MTKAKQSEQLIRTLNLRSSLIVPIFIPSKIYVLFGCFLSILIGLHSPLVGQTLVPQPGVNNGIVSAIAEDNNYFYIGGTFTSVGGARPGRFAKISTTNDQVTVDQPLADRNVNVVVPDGSGGWFIGGLIRVVDGLPRLGIAHIFSDGTLDLEWDPKMSSGAVVNSIVVLGSDIYVGGSFSMVGGQTRNNLVKLNKTTGEVDLDWDPNITGGAVNTIVVSDGDIYVGGSFTSVGGLTRNRLVKLNNTIGAVDASWDPNPNNTVQKITISGDDIYLGGVFTSIGGVSYNRLAKLNKTTGTADATWNPNPNNTVFDMAIASDAIYVGGNFTSVGGETRNRLAKLNKITGEVDPTWNPDSGGVINSIAISGSDIFVGGTFTTVGGLSRDRIAKLNNTTGTSDADWDPKANNTVNSIAISGSDVFFGGRFDVLKDIARNRVARISKITNEIDPDWNPNANNFVNTIVVSGSEIYLGGRFTNVGGQSLNRLAKVNNTTGDADADWNPNANGDVNTIEIADSDIYLGGAFTTIGGQTRNRIAKINKTTGTLDPDWNPIANGTVRTIAISGSDIYLGGVFTTIGDQIRNRIAKINKVTGVLDPDWNPNAGSTFGNEVFSIAVSGDDIYVGGIFNSLGGLARSRIAKLNNTTGVADPIWNPNAANTVNVVNSIAISESDIYVGGSFPTIGGVSRVNLAKLNNTDGAVDPLWIADAENISSTVASVSVNIVLISANYLYAGGSFTSINGIPTARFVVLKNSNDPPPTPSAPIDLAAIQRNGEIEITFTAGSDGGSAIINYEYSLNEGDTWVPLDPVQTISPLTITGIDNTVSYTIQLRAVNAAGAGTASSSVAIPALFAGGAGTIEDPYQIEDWRHLHNIRENLVGYYILNNNINETSSGYETYASATANDNQGWIPFGKFTGRFDGKNHFIKGLIINRPQTDYVGLFSETEGGHVNNLGLIDVSIVGKDFVGGLIGSKIAGNFSKLYVKGSVSGVNQVGGLAGRQHSGGSLNNSYTDVEVFSSGIHLGGFVGLNNDGGTINTSYSVGKVTGSGSDIGGFTGFMDNGGRAQNCFWDTETSGLLSSAGGTGKSTAEMKTLTTFTDANWDFNATTGIWKIEAGDYISYPYLQNLNYDEPESEPEVNPIPGLVQITLPELTTATPLDVTTVSTKLGGEITSDGGAAVTDRGIVWSQSSNPTISDTKVEMESGTGTFSGTVTGLPAGSTIYVRAYATNSIGTAYGEDLSFDTQTAPLAPIFTSSPITTIPYGEFYNYIIEGSVESDLETTISSPTMPAWLSFSAGESGVASLAGTVPNGFRLRGTAADNDGNINTILTDGTQIFKITPDGTSTSWRSGIPGNVFSLHIANGYLYISRNNNFTNSITRVPLNNPSAVEEVFLTRPGGVISLIDKDGFIYAANYPSSEILKINETTKEVSVVLSDLFSNSPFGLTIDNDNNLFFAAFEINSILKYDGIELITVLSDLPTGPTSIKTDDSGNFYISMDNGGIRKYSSDFSSFEVVSMGASDNIWSLSLSSSGLLVYAKVNTNEVYRLQTRNVLTGTPAKSDVGNHTVTLRATNDAGFTDQEFTITVTDETAPLVSTFAPTHNATDVEFQPSLFITFDEEVVLGNTGMLTVNNGSTILRQYDLSVPADRNEIGISGDHLSLSIDLDISLPFNTDITVGISTGFVEDQAGNVFEGFIPESNTWKFTTINKLNQTITFSEIDPKTYGDATFTLGDTETDQGLAVTYTAEDPSIVSISGNQATILKVGTTTIIASQSGTSQYFAAEPIERTLIVNKAALIVTADLNQGKAYGTAEPALTFNATGFESSDNESVFTGNLARASGEDVGAYAINQGTLSAGDNYSIEFTETDFNITTKTLTVMANPEQAKVYGANDPELTFKATGFVNEDDESIISGTLTRAAGEDVGVYAINQGTLSAGDNYSIEFTGADFNITTKTLTVMANPDQSKVYGANDPALTFKAIGFESSDDESIFTGTLARAAGEDVGTYAINKGTISAGKNYSIDFIGDNFSITTKTLTVMANPEQSKVYGANDPALTFKATGFEGNDYESVLTGSLVRVAGEVVGAYTINQGDLNSNDNYKISFKGAEFTIVPATVTGVDLMENSYIYDGISKSLTITGELPEGTSITYSNNSLVNVGSKTVTATITGANYITLELTATLAITPAVVTGVELKDGIFVYDGTSMSLAIKGKLPSGTSVAYSNNSLTNVGSKVVIASISGLNYMTLSLSAELKVTPASVIITAADKKKVYGQANPSLTITYLGLVNGDTQVTTEPSISTIANTDSNVGTYPITLSGGADANYNITLVEGELEVIQATLTITANEGQSKIFGTADPVLSYSATGFAAGDDEQVLTGTLIRDVGEAVGIYPINLGSLVAGGNYQIVYKSADFEIIPAVIEAVMQPAPIETVWGVYPGLPSTVTVITTDGQFLALPIIWDLQTLYVFRNGEYQLTATINLPSGILNTEALTVEIVVTVLPKPAPEDILLDNNSFEADAGQNFIAVGNLTVIDPIDNQHDISLADMAFDNVFFQINSGTLFWNSAERADGRTEFKILIRVQDRDGNILEKEFTIIRNRTSVSNIEIFNSFTPDGDNVNDTWGVAELRFYSGVVIQIFERSGKRLFYTQNPDIRWDGTFENIELPTGTYYWTVEVKETGEVRKGMLNLFRK
ncbi:MBG domain-containing protein [Belliella buryatensis]|nr:MBG domain-containing protein [Belliella buryatensis]